MRVIARVTPPSEFQARVKNVHGSCREKAPPGEDRFLVVTHPVIVTTLEAACIYICHEVKCCSPVSHSVVLLLHPLKYWPLIGLFSQKSLKYWALIG